MSEQTSNNQAHIFNFGAVRIVEDVSLSGKSLDDVLAVLHHNRSFVYSISL